MNTSHRNPKCRSRLGIVVLACAVLLLSLCGNKGVAQTEAWEYSPYRVQVWLTLGPSAELGTRAQTHISESLMTNIDSLIGAPWRAEVVPPPIELHSALLYDHTYMTPERLEEVAPDVFKLDKIILLTVKTTPREYVVEARDFDCRTRLFGVVVRRVVRQRAYLVPACFQAMTDAFRAMTRLEEGEPKAAKVRIRAGGLILSQDSPCYIGQGDALLPIQRTNDRKGGVRSIVAIDWTYLVVRERTELSPYLMDCRVWSGKPNPVQGRVTSRKERYALKVQAFGTKSVLRVEARVKKNETPYPMAGLEVYAKYPIEDPPKEDSPPTPPPAAEGEAGEGEETADGEAETASDGEEAVAEGEATGEGEPSDEPSPPEGEAAPATPEPEPTPNPPVLVGVTDWRGMLTVEQADMPLRIYYLKNGGQLLARLPLIPGLAEEFVAQVPDDGPRLQAEGFIKGLQGQLMDVEAQRQILYARFQKRLAESNFIEAEALYEEFLGLPTKLELIDQLNTQKSVVIEPPPNRIVKARIDNLYDSMSEALGKYLSPKLANTMLAELRTAKAKAPAATTASPAE